MFVKNEAKLEDGNVIAKPAGTEFTIQGQFCPTLHKAMKRRKKREKVPLRVGPRYSFGEKRKPAIGDEGAVPTNALLNFVSELVSWKTGSNVSNDKEVKKIQKEEMGLQMEGQLLK